jgi:hypothetical protein
MGVTTGLGGEECMAFQRKVAIGVKAPYPSFIAPALATYIENVPGGERWVHQIKFDATDAQVHVATRRSRSSPVAATTGPSVSARLLTTPGTSLPVRRSLTARSLSRPRAAPLRGSLGFGRPCKSSDRPPPDSMRWANCIYRVQHVQRLRARPQDEEPFAN